MKAREAIYFLNEHFSSKHPRIIGQTREQAIKNKKLFSLECPDDEILQCCLQIRELGRSVVRYLTRNTYKIDDNEVPILNLILIIGFIII